MVDVVRWQAVVDRVLLVSIRLRIGAYAYAHSDNYR